MRLFRLIQISLCMLVASAASANAASPHPRHMGVGCVDAVCAAINEEGKIFFLDMNHPKIQVGTAQIQVTAPGPVNVSCNVFAGKERCAAVDAGGKVWWIDPRAPGDVQSGPALH